MHSCTLLGTFYLLRGGKGGAGRPVVDLTLSPFPSGAITQTVGWRGVWRLTRSCRRAKRARADLGKQLSNGAHGAYGSEPTPAYSVAPATVQLCEDSGKKKGVCCWNAFPQKGRRNKETKPSSRLEFFKCFVTSLEGYASTDLTWFSIPNMVRPSTGYH